MRNLFVSLSLSFFFTLPLSAQTTAKPTPAPVYNEGNRREAERLWELAVSAKGGREKLQAVRNIVEISDATARWSLFKTYKIHRVDVYLFPWKWWSWDDQRDSVFGIDEAMYNSETGLKYIFDPRSKSPPPSLVPFETPRDRATRGVKMSGFATYLLVLSWFEPKVLGITSENKTDVIHTDFNGGRIDFALDRKTHLPVLWTVSGDGHSNGEWMKNYKEFDGIMMATHTGPLDESGRYTHTYEFNAEIDDSIWEHPPAFSLGADGWRKRK